MQEVIDRIKELTGHGFVEFTEKGDTAIFSALYCARQKSLEKFNSDKKDVLIPDQGGWLTYPKYPKMLEMNAVEVKTDDGKIDIEDLKQKVDNAICFIYQNPAGYFAENDIKKIYDVCKGKCLVILDITGSIGDKSGEYADYTVCSFGRWKLVNLKYGGCVTAKDESLFAKEIFKTTNFDESKFPELMERLGKLEQRRDFLIAECKKVKEDLRDYDVVYPDDKSLIVVVGFSSDSEREKIINYCDKNNYEWTLCPRYIRIMKDAISIEVKRKQVSATPKYKILR